MKQKSFFLLYTFYKKGKRDTPDLEGAKSWAVCKKSDGKYTVGRILGNCNFWCRN